MERAIDIETISKDGLNQTSSLKMFVSYCVTEEKFEEHSLWNLKRYNQGI